ncbi:MAG: ChrR family anti-sigma-E factor [Pseudomonadota bacterium]|nr:ChrR family anti-sigma-E factor [Pseudomonadota bacterium]
MSHRPDIHWLTDYAAGTLPSSQALCVAVHLSFCPESRKQVEQLNSLGAIMFTNAINDDDNLISESVATELPDEDHASINQELRSKVFDLIDKEDIKQQPSSVTASPCANDASNKADLLPHCLQKLIPDGIDQLDWKKLGTALSVARLSAGDDSREVALHKIKAGGRVSNHDHRGREVTVVLQGSFSDQNGLYLPGDFLVKEAGQEHRPIASEDAECICLSVLEAPVKFTGPITSLINPFLKIKTGTP